jgi:WD40 repeat protein
MWRNALLGSAMKKNVLPERVSPLTAAGLALLAIIAASLHSGSSVAWAEPADSYVQSGDAANAPYLSRSRDGTRVVKRSDTNDYDVEVWDLNANKRLSSITGLSGVVNTANISPDGRKVVTAERRGIVGVWDADTGKRLMLLRGHEDQIHDARFSPDGSMIASAARDGTARTWDAATGAQLAVHKQRGGYYVDDVSFSPDGRWVLSGGNGWAEIWDPRTGKLLTSVFVGPQDATAFDTYARFSADGKSIAVGDINEGPQKMLPVELPAN